MSLEKAKLIELDDKFNDKKAGGKVVEVQFNPESLKLTYANQLEKAQSKSGDQASGNGGMQFIGAGTTKLALQLWFDVTAMQKDPVDDVRRLTQEVIYFMTPNKPGEKVPPGTRFSWGSFIFDGIVEGIEENIEFFSPEGKPLRANISLTISQQKIFIAEFTGTGNVPALPGHKPLTSAKAGDSLQNMAAKGGKGNWQSIAAANGIEDPLRMSAGQLLDLNAGVSGGIALKGGLAGSIGFDTGKMSSSLKFNR